MKIEKYGTAGDIEELLAVRDSVDTLLNAHITASPLSVRADMFDIGDAFQVHIEVPGVDQSDLELAIEDDELQVAGLRGPVLGEAAVDAFGGQGAAGDQGATRNRFILTERASGPFQRSFRLPAPVRPDAATAHLSRGVLVVTIPKA